MLLTTKGLGVYRVSSRVDASVEEASHLLINGEAHPGVWCRLDPAAEDDLSCDDDAYQWDVDSCAACFPVPA